MNNNDTTGAASQTVPAATRKSKKEVCVRSRRRTIAKKGTAQVDKYSNDGAGSTGKLDFNKARRQDDQVIARLIAETLAGAAAGIGAPAIGLTPTDVRMQLRRNGFDPIPVIGKRPPLDEWQKRTETSAGDIEMWAKLYPDARNTGILTRHAPTLDIDILDPDAADAVEGKVREILEDFGDIHVRFRQVTETRDRVPHR
ncbi:bifunctional DNA primase/polymerase [Bradyrhizobium diazoefficiens]